jgi:hypothetical protein
LLVPGLPPLPTADFSSDRERKERRRSLFLTAVSVSVDFLGEWKRLARAGRLIDSLCNRACKFAAARRAPAGRLAARLAVLT